MGKGRDSVEELRNAGTGSSPAGGQFEIQFNDGGAFAADVDFGYNSAVKKMYADKLQSADPDASGAGEFITTLDSAGDLNKSTKTIEDIAPTPAAGNSNEIQYNTGGIFAASSTFKRDAITGRIEMPLLKLSGTPASIDDADKVMALTATGDVKSSSTPLSDIGPSGSNYEIQFNGNGTFGTDPGFFYDDDIGYLQFPIARMSSTPASSPTDNIVVRSSADGQLNVASLTIGDLAGFQKAILFGKKSSTSSSEVVMLIGDLGFLGGQNIIKLMVRVSSFQSAIPSVDLIANITMIGSNGAYQRILPITLNGDNSGLTSAAEVSQYNEVPQPYSQLSVQIVEPSGTVHIVDNLEIQIDAIPV